MKVQHHPVLKLDGLGVSFGKRVVLDGITLSLLPNGIDVLMGPVKSGKSTLMRTLAGLYEGHELHKSWGNISIVGKALTPINRPILYQQHSRALDQTLLQALIKPIRETQPRKALEWREQALEWLKIYGLSEYIPLADLPLMQCKAFIQRRIMILAQALLKPHLLMIDEPTFGLSEEDANLMIDWLKKLSPLCKLWVALHNQMQARRLSSHIILIGGGHLIAHQKTTDFFQHPANEWVAQFIRTGGLSLPSPDAIASDLSDDIAAPPPLSPDALAAIQTALATVHNMTSVAPITIEPPHVTPPPETVESAKKNENTPTVFSQIFDPIEPIIETVAIPSDAPRALYNKPESTPHVLGLQSEYATSKTSNLLFAAANRKPIDLPPPSLDGVELASTVGNIIMRESSAPRGFHWIVPGKLAGCPAPGVSAPIDYDLKLLAKVGIKRLITLTETDLDQDALLRHNMCNTHLPIFDRESPSIGQTHMLLIRMQKYLAAGEVLAVHCKAGLGRTGTILAAWLIRDGGLSASDSMARLRRIEPGFIQSADQEAFLHHYEADLTNRII